MCGDIHVACAPTSHPAMVLQIKNLETSESARPMSHKYDLNELPGKF